MKKYQTLASRSDGGDRPPVEPIKMLKITVEGLEKDDL